MRYDLPEWAVWFDIYFTEDAERIRHRVLFGGRGGAKSWTIAHKIVERARRQKLRILCTREFQNSIRDSAKKLIEDSIARLGLSDFFTITENEIRGRNGSVISFLGLNGKEQAIKSLEGYDLAWVEEAATLSQASLDALIPTIRKEGSEIWWSYNPRYPSDPVDQLFRGGKPPPGSIVLEVQWRDNPWFPEVLRRDMEYDRERDPERHAHVWEGHYVIRSEAQVFRNWQVLRFESPQDARYRFGADWGFSRDPTVLVRCFIGRLESEGTAAIAVPDSKGRALFIDFEAYAVGCPIDATPALFAGSDRRTPPRWPNVNAYPGIEGAARTKITADSARPETIDHMKRLGFDIQAAIKGPGSVEDGIEFLRSFDIIVHPRCRHLQEELTHYSYKVDRQTGEILSQLADRDNHVIDALRYALEGARKAGSDGFKFASSRGRITAERLKGFLIEPTRPRSSHGKRISVPGALHHMWENY
ncbi:PBSX family phage terminase large subunit [Altererythrobacter sp. Z27]|uniref:PBSX family phage terminase large subunit n=1 Tax=Altererythrobacter sp. Z27 TaxID=3461147 RepID=UPI004043FF3E